MHDIGAYRKIILPGPIRWMRIQRALRHVEVLIEAAVILRFAGRK